MSWLTDIMETGKPVIAMCHLQALPGDPGYDAPEGLDWVIECARRDPPVGADLQNAKAGAPDHGDKFNVKH